jgi:hypothetical protein
VLKFDATFYSFEFLLKYIYTSIYRYIYAKTITKRALVNFSFFNSCGIIMSIFSSSSQNLRWIFGSQAALLDARISAHMQRAAPPSATAEITMTALTEEARAEVVERIDEDDYILRRFSHILRDCCGPTEAHPIKRSWKVAVSCFTVSTDTSRLHRFVSTGHSHCILAPLLCPEFPSRP